jgi:hypothetical protein
MWIELGIDAAIPLRKKCRRPAMTNLTAEKGEVRPAMANAPLTFGRAHGPKLCASLAAGTDGRSKPGSLLPGSTARKCELGERLWFHGDAVARGRRRHVATMLHVNRINHVLVQMV